MKTLETVEVEEVDESIIKSDSLGVGNIDLNKIIKDNFIMCAGKECWCTSYVGKQNKTDFQDITVDEIILKQASENVNKEDHSESSERSSVCEIHNRIVKGIGLKCINSDAPLLNDHNHQSCSPREAQVQEKEVAPSKYMNSVQHYYDESSLLPPRSNVVHHSSSTFSEFPSPFTSIKCSTPLSNHVSCASFKMSLLSDEGSFEMDSNFDFSEAMVENNSLGENIVESAKVDLDVDINDLSKEGKESKSTATCEQMPTPVKVKVNQDCKPEDTFVEAATSSTDTSNEEETCDNSVESDIYIHVSYK